MDDHDKQRLAIVEASTHNLNGVVVEIKDYLKTSLRERADNHSEVIQRLAIIETKQDAFREYQTKCEKDRIDISNRVTAIELDDSNKAGRSSIITMLLASFVSGLVAIVAAILGRGHS